MDETQEHLARALNERGLVPDPERTAAIAPALQSLRRRLLRLSESLPERADLPPTPLDNPRP